MRASCGVAADLRWAALGRPLAGLRLRIDLHQLCGRCCPLVGVVVVLPWLSPRWCAFGHPPFLCTDRPSRRARGRCSASARPSSARRPSRRRARAPPPLHLDTLVVPVSRAWPVACPPSVESARSCYPASASTRACAPPPLHLDALVVACVGARARRVPALRRVAALVLYRLGLDARVRSPPRSTSTRSWSPVWRVPTRNVPAISGVV